MTSCTSCGTNVTGKRFCPDCGTAVQVGTTQTTSGQNLTACPNCRGGVNPGAAFCMHCGASLRSQVPAGGQAQGTVPTGAQRPATIACPACHAHVLASTTFCTQCGHDVRIPVAPQAGVGYCTNCGRQNEAHVRFCGSCGNTLVGTGQYNQPAYAQAGSGQYTNPQPHYSQPSGPYQQYPSQSNGQPQPQYPPQPNGQSQPQYPSQPYSQPQGQYPSQPYGQPQYPPQPYGQGQSGYPQPYGQPGYLQPQMILRCPTCMAMAPVGTPNCLSCRTNLAGVAPTPASMPVLGQQQQGMGGFLQGNNGKMAMGALGGAAAVIGGEMLLHGIENKIENDIEYGHRRHHRDEGLLGGLGELGEDIGLF